MRSGRYMARRGRAPRDRAPGRIGRAARGFVRPGERRDQSVTTETRLETAPGPPTIEGQTAVAGELAAARINGTLCLTDAACGLWTLQLPDLAWRSLDDEPSSECRFAVSATGQHLIGNADWSPTGYLGAAERETDGGRPRILVISDATDWTFSFAGSAPAFRPDGALTFVRRGTLWGWVEGPCRPGEESVVFRSPEAAVERCARVLLPRGEIRSAFRRGIAAVQDPTLGEAVWLDARTLVVLVHGDTAGHGIAVLVDGEVRAQHAAWVSQVSDLEASPLGTRVAYRAGGVLVFDRNLRDAGFLADARAIAWPSDQRLTVEATNSSLYLIRPGESMIHIPVAASDIAWVD